MDLIKQTIGLAMQNVEEGGRPFATVIARNGEIIAQSPNQVAQTQDPTAHAEILAIRQACKKLGRESLHDCEIYILASPCPMCLGALYYCSPKQVIYLTTREEYAPYYRDDRHYFELETFYDEFARPISERRLPMVHAGHHDALKVYQRWQRLNPR
ncbi:tRNA-specific adenosine deaminase [Erwinia sp. OLTSP20]|uniref:nucleoside deaminase n=1 Tax=unclassified Erwinia TaxID=2622719 RepID=UPI000C190283|nr:MULTISPECIES: nucleoside deaminase [unclassified Erwinia]PIJ50910.1 tRNA-specific adenosine deaminase [Erwinia sp. OAMSP11]PIJ75962.1 tRNA-specific adenosine deaminase [Erwinia sp. OLSSP12]PIJ83592.1 tRNA-specific adenosine deaminase [Erwinia sp. OLCASP19]PIJ87447.1 tRNA-specific adenosine deaminase [Erwinia sp. OLMTSP26]PIJ88997.1 tRNA-specific adenosine deaminase [Erwinia sp. OLMDSP33]